MSSGRLGTRCVLPELLALLAPTAGDLVVAAPRSAPGFWAGGPSVVFDDGWWLAYRLRRPVDQGRGYANVVARSSDGLHFEPVATVTSDQLGCASLERPALVRRPDGGWRLYVSCSSLGSKHWWVEALDAEQPGGLAAGRRTVVLPGSATVAWKDVVVLVDAAGTWRMWACRHPLDGGDDEADRMSTWYATSDDGLRWELHGEALGPGSGWDARGARVTAVLPEGDGWCALYDGRASAAENWYERTGLARGAAGTLAAEAGPVPAAYGPALRYATVAADPAGTRVYFEATSAAGSHDLRTVYVPRPVGLSQSV